MNALSDIDPPLENLLRQRARFQSDLLRAQARAGVCRALLSDAKAKANRKKNAAKDLPIYENKIRVLEEWLSQMQGLILDDAIHHHPVRTVCTSDVQRGVERFPIRQTIIEMDARR